VIMYPTFILVIGTSILQLTLAERNLNVDILYEGSDDPYDYSDVGFDDLNNQDGYYPQGEDYDYVDEDYEYGDEEGITFDDNDGYFEAYYNFPDHHNAPQHYNTPHHYNKMGTVKSDKSLYEIARTYIGRKGDLIYGIMAELIELAGLDELLSDCSINATKYTLFTFQTPAMKRFGKSSLEKLKKEKHREQLRKLILHHIVPEEIKYKNLKNGKLKSLGGGTIRVKNRRLKKVIKRTAYKKEGINAWVNNDHTAGCNGIHHGINAVLIPKGLKLP